MPRLPATASAGLGRAGLAGARRRPRHRGRRGRDSRSGRLPADQREQTIRSSSRSSGARSARPIMGGRIDDIAVVESNPSIIYVGFATGGLWKTINNGTTWTPIFDELPGHVDRRHRGRAVESRHHLRRHRRAEQPPELVVRRRRLQVDRRRRKTSKYVGLKETQSIARIVVHPKDPNIVYVAAVGHLFGPNPERGLYKTTDGGKTWTNTKFIDNDTGFTDVVMDPAESEHPLRGLVPAPPAAVGLQRRRPRQRHLEDDRRRQRPGRS